VYLVRHGETEWSRSGRHTSFTDVPLTDGGREQARANAARLSGQQFARVLTSPRTRAMETCALAGLLSRAEVTDDLAEWDYGDYEGRTTTQIRAEAPGWTIFTGAVPGGETPAAVAARADRLIERVIATNDAVALFSHGHFLRVLAARWLGCPPTFGAALALDTATICILGHEHERRVLRKWNA
jgi:probable phosphoglycerate mutase